MASVIEARVVSVTEQEVHRVIGNTDRGSILYAKFEWEKIGGLKNFKLVIARTNELPLFSGMRFDFYFRDEVFITNRKIFSGYSEITPSRETDELTIEIEGKGYYWKLEQRTLNVDYTTQTINGIINDLDLSGLDITLSETEINPPSGTHTIYFKDKTYVQVLDTLLKIANSEYSDVQYIWGVDENRELYFKPLPSTGDDVAQKFFEGFDFQKPEVSFDNKIVNKVLLYRPTSADEKESELIGTYENTVSQGQYGIYDKKIMIGDYVDDTSAEAFADAILQEFSEPKKMISIKNFYRKDAIILSGLIAYDDGTDQDTMIVDPGTGTEDFEYRVSDLNEERFRRIWEPDFYGVSTKPQEKITVVNECELASEWSTNLSYTVFNSATSNVLTGRRVLSLGRAANQPGGDYIEYELPNVISGLIDVRIRMYFYIAVPDISVKFYDIEGNYIEIKPNMFNNELIGKWMQFIYNCKNDSYTSNLYVKQSGSLKKPLAVDSNSSTTGLLIGSTKGSIRNLAKVRIELGEGNKYANLIALDRIEAKNKSWEYSRLTLDKAVYTIDKDYVISDMEFGNKKSSIVDELNNSIQKGDLAFDMFTKS